MSTQLCVAAKHTFLLKASWQHHSSQSRDREVKQAAYKLVASVEAGYGTIIRFTVVNHEFAFSEAAFHRSKHLQRLAENSSETAHLALPAALSIKWVPLWNDRAGPAALGLQDQIGVAKVPCCPVRTDVFEHCLLDQLARSSKRDEAAAERS